jgi:hypothetical protein
MTFDVTFKPTNDAGLILFASRYKNGSGPFILMQLNKTLQFAMNTGQYKITLSSQVAVKLNDWHIARVTYYSSINYAALELDGKIVSFGLLEKIHSTSLHQSTYGLRLSSGSLYIGKLPSIIAMPPDLLTKQGFVGCLEKVNFVKLVGYYTVEGIINLQNIEKCYEINP